MSADPLPLGPVAIVTPRYPPSVGGIERYVEQLAVGLVRRGARVTVVATDTENGSPPYEVRQGVVVHRLPVIGRDHRGQSLVDWLSDNAGQFSVLNGHNLHSLLPAMTSLAARRANVPFVLTGHWHGAGRSVPRQVMHIPYRPIAMWTARSADAVIYNSNSERELLERQLGVHRRLVFIPEGAGLVEPQTARQPGSDPDGVIDRRTILSVGRLEPYKGTEMVVRALAQLSADWRLVVVGGGSARASIEEAAANLGVSDRVVLRGTVSDDEVHDWYARAVVCVSLSAQESFGLVALEAAASGCPVVLSDIPAHRDLTAFVPSSRLTFVARNAPAAVIADAIETAAARGRISSKTMSAADGWHLPTWDALVERTLELFLSVAL